MIYARALGDTLRRLLEGDPRVVLLGEDIADPYGGAFKVTRGLSSDYPERVCTTPVSEGAIVGIAGGLALCGFRPIVEIMFGDFLSLCFDQISNHAAKFELMYDRQSTCPVVVRTPSGGRRGYGPTHSQSLEKHFLGIPHLRTVAASLLHDPVQVFRDLLEDSRPCLHVEHKLLYPRQMIEAKGGQAGDLLVSEHRSAGHLPTYALAAVPREECSVTVLAYGYQAVMVQEVIRKLAMEEEIFVELLVPADLSPPDYAPIEESVEKTGALVTVEEGTAGWSWGTEIAVEIGKRLFGRLRRPVEVLASRQGVIPAARHLEEEMLVNAAQIEEAVREAAS